MRGLSRLREAGKRNSASDATIIQQVHDNAVDLGATCGMGESGHALTVHGAAALLESTGLSQSDLAALLRSELAELYPGTSVWVRDIYGDSVVYTVYGYPAYNDSTLYERPYTLVDGDGDGIPEDAEFGDPVEVMSVTSYVPVGADESDAGGVAERQFTQGQRDKMAAAGTAMGDGSFPIANASDLANAVNAYGRAKNKDAAKKHITARAKALNATDKLPADWAGSTKQESAGESVDVTGDLVPLVETAVKKDGSATIKIIQAGQGSSGYYPADVLKRDGPKVFAEGTHIYLDHPTLTQERDHPERSVKDLAGSLTGPATWEEHGAAGPGLYAPVKFIDSVAPHINAIAPISGMSIRASGKAGTREIDGKKVRTIEELDAAHSIDVVTRAGAGGKVVDLIESARNGRTPRSPSGGDGMNLEEALARIADLEAARPPDARELAEKRQRLTEATARVDALERDNARLREQSVLREATAVIADVLGGLDLHQLTRERLTKELIANPPVKDGGLDRELFTQRVTETAQAEQNYLVLSTGTNGKVRGMGGFTPEEEDATKALAESFVARGYSKEIAERMAAL